MRSRWESSVWSTRAHLSRWVCALLSCASAAVWAQSPAPTPSAAPVERLRIVGGLAGVNQYTRHEEPFWTRELARLTKGEATAEIVSFDQAGLSGTEVLRAVQTGTVPFGTLLLALSAATEPELAWPDLAGLNPDFASVERSVAAHRPQLAQLLRERFGIELLAIYAYPAQVIFCAKPFAGLGDLVGRRIRVSSVTQADFVTGLGAQPVQFPFAQIVPSVRAGTADCAITGTMSGNTIGLHEVTSHVHPMAINWGLSAFVVQRARWLSLKPSVRQVIERELPKLERAIWDESDRDTADGLACNLGLSSCKGGRKGAMKLVATSPADEKLRQELLSRTVLPAFQKRCGVACSALVDGAARPVDARGR